MADKEKTPEATTTTAAAGSPSKSPTPEAATGLAAALPADHWEHAPDTVDDDADSAISTIATSTDSLSSSILHYRTINGRTYHSEIGNAQYWGSNDEGHSQSLDMWHHMITLLLEDKLYLAPIKDPKKALDIGTGTGIWAIDFADAHPGCQVIGTDVSPMQPAWVPPNLTFEIEDCTQEWTFAENDFDYIHMRALLGSIPDWNFLFQQAYRALKPGGWIESHEMSVIALDDDVGVDPNSAVGQWGPLFVEGSKLTGRPFLVIESNLQQEAATAAGFQDMQVHQLKGPMGDWPADPRLKQAGQLAQVSILQDVEGFIGFLTTILGWPIERVTVYVAHLRRELLRGTNRLYTKHRTVWAQKPLDA